MTWNRSKVALVGLGLIGFGCLGYAANKLTGLLTLDGLYLIGFTVGITL